MLGDKCNIERSEVRITYPKETKTPIRKEKVNTIFKILFYILQILKWSLLLLLLIVFTVTTIILSISSSSSISGKNDSTNGFLQKFLTFWTCRIKEDPKICTVDGNVSHDSLLEGSARVALSSCWCQASQLVHLAAVNNKLFPHRF